ncbi:MAG: phosphate ABC transporter substrate-binding protein PstS [Thermoguttaceae bacterium]
MRMTRVILRLCLPLVVLSAVSCNSRSGGDATDRVRLQGAGASFPAPLYNKWFKSYHDAHSNVEIDYQSVGSGAGVKAVQDKTVDFGASDAAMTAEEMAKVEAGVQLLPMTAGSIVLAYNLEGVDDLKLPRETYVGMFLGKVSKWNDPSIVAANPAAKLPDSNINVVVRADSSGTSFVFTKHLSAISEEFAKSPGTNKMPNWPVGTKSKGNEGVSAAINTTPGAIGYMEYGYAKGTKLKMATLQNKAGKYVEPTIASGQAALASVKMPDDLVVWVSDPKGEDAYPIVTYTWIMTYKKYADPKKAAALRDVLAYCLTDGQKQSELLGYIPLPGGVVETVKAALGNIGAEAAEKKAK